MNITEVAIVLLCNLGIFLTGYVYGSLVQIRKHNEKVDRLEKYWNKDIRQ